MRVLILNSLIVLFSANIGFANKDSLTVKLKYYASANAGYIICSNCSEWGSVDFSASIVQGLNLNDRYTIGMGVGTEHYGRIGSRPLFLRIEKNYTGLTGRFGLGLDADMSFLRDRRDDWNWNGEMQRSRALILHPHFVIIAGEKKTKLTGTIGYRYIKSTLNYTSGWNGDTEVDMVLKRLTLGLGLRFN